MHAASGFPIAAFFFILLLSMSLADIHNPIIRELASSSASLRPSVHLLNTHRRCTTGDSGEKMIVPYCLGIPGR